MEREKHSIDAQGKVAGRIASRIAILLQGKNKVSYQKHTDCGDRVVVSNTDKMKFTGKKLVNKVYHRFTGYPGGIRTTRLAEMVEKNPDLLLRRIVFNMLPKNKLRANMIKRLSFSHEPKKSE